MSREIFKYQRGDIYLIEEHQVQGKEQKKTRPWVLVGATPINKARGTAIAVPLSTSAPEKPPLSIKLYVNNTFVSAIIDQVRAIDKRRFIRFEGSLSQDEIDLLDDGLRQVLGL